MRRYGVSRPLSEMEVTSSDEATREADPAVVWVIVNSYQNLKLMVYDAYE